MNHIYIWIRSETPQASRKCKSGTLGRKFRLEPPRMHVKTLSKLTYVPNAWLGFEFGRTPARRPAVTVLERKCSEGADKRLLKCCKIQVH